MTTPLAGVLKELGLPPGVTCSTMDHDASTLWVLIPIVLVQDPTDEGRLGIEYKVPVEILEQVARGEWRPLCSELFRRIRNAYMHELDEWLKFPDGSYDRQPAHPFTGETYP